MVDITQGLEFVSDIMKRCIEREIPGSDAENPEDFLLDDVNSFISVYHNDHIIDDPCIWMVEHPITPEEHVNISKMMDLKATFEFVCVKYDPDLEVAEKLAKNLATRVGKCISKHYLHVQKELLNTRLIEKIEFQAFYPNGEVQITGKSDKVPATGLILEVFFKIDWRNCCRKNNINEGD